MWPCPSGCHWENVLQALCHRPGASLRFSFAVAIHNVVALNLAFRLTADRLPNPRTAHAFSNHACSLTPSSSPWQAHAALCNATRDAVSTRAKVDHAALCRRRLLQKLSLNDGLY